MTRMEAVAQDVRRADALRPSLERIRLPEGVRVEFSALAPDARRIAVDRSSGVVCSAICRNWA
ncbi:hypothetical protein E2C06_01025 [Dankookia rubra]|uniref:Uncharacterized protein n=1 Tax=Dankookia rubra TaxID=1442381 RepID=A0A4R5QPJ4_9PROT|nr:hypothetical protein [Dankookia rubra]TDH64557.1 hypothetical protein E2C06_01025 [Dankookia rubra]